MIRVSTLKGGGNRYCTRCNVRPGLVASGLCGYCEVEITVTGEYLCSELGPASNRRFSNGQGTADAMWWVDLGLADPEPNVLPPAEVRAILDTRRGADDKWWKDLGLSDPDAPDEAAHEALRPAYDFEEDLKDLEDWLGDQGDGLAPA